MPAGFARCASHSDMLARMAAPFPFELSDQCVKCGLCLPHCPTYQLSASESEGPRGRIAIMESIAAASIALTSTADEHLGNCLGCARCESVCPAKVQYLEIRDHHKSSHVHWPRTWLLWALSRGQSPFRLNALRLLHRFSSWLPAALFGRKIQAWRQLLGTQTLGYSDRTGALAPRSTSDGVALFRGCVASNMDARAHNAAASLLAQLNDPVYPSSRAQCCGALAQHGGDMELAQRQRNQLAMDQNPLVAMESGCIADLRRSGRDVTEACRYLLNHWPRQWQPKIAPQTVALHLPCTHHNGCGDTAAVSELLSRIDGLSITEIRGLGCCGAGGLHAVERPEHAAQFAQRLLAEIPQGVDTLVSTNVGCRSHLRVQAPHLEIRHPLELLQDSLSMLLPHGPE